MHKRKSTTFILLISIIGISALLVPSKGLSAEWILYGKFTVGSGYSNNSYIDYITDKYKQRAYGLGFVVTGNERTLDSKLNLNASYTFQAFYGAFGLGISTGFFGMIDEARFFYQKSTDWFAPGRVSAISYLLPQTANFYFKAQFNEKNAFIFGFGSGDYIYLNIREGKINKVALLQNNYLIYNDYYAQFPHEYFILTNGMTVEHNLGAQASIEYSYQLNYSFSIQAGIKGLYIFNKNGSSLVMHLTMGVTSRILTR